MQILFKMGYVNFISKELFLISGGSIKKNSNNANLIPDFPYVVWYELVSKVKRFIGFTIYVFCFEHSFIPYPTFSNSVITYSVNEEDEIS